MKMGSHTLLFLKDFKVVDRIFMNHPVKNAWEYGLVKKFAEESKDFLKSCEGIYSKDSFKYLPKFNAKDKKASLMNSLEAYKLIDLILQPLAKLYLYNKETIVRIIDGKTFKENLVTIHYSKEGGWATDKVMDDLIDSKKKYDYVIYLIGSEGIKNKQEKLICGIVKSINKMKE